MGMVGGGRGAFIGGVHRRAAALDGQIELIAGAFSSDPKKSALSGKDFFIEPYFPGSSTCLCRTRYVFTGAIKSEGSPAQIIIFVVVFKPL